MNTNEHMLYSMAELEQLYISEARNSKAVLTTVEDGYFVLRPRNHDTLPEGFEDHIAIKRIPTSAALMQWTHHLSEKSWMDVMSLRRFMQVVSQHQGFDLQTPA